MSLPDINDVLAEMIDDHDAIKAVIEAGATHDNGGWAIVEMRDGRRFKLEAKSQSATNAGVAEGQLALI